MRISDWSSDVCASDLRKAEETIFEAPPIIDESGRCLDYSVDQRGLTWRRCYPVPFDQPKRESRRLLCPIRSAVTRGQQESTRRDWKMIAPPVDTLAVDRHAGSALRIQAGPFKLEERRVGQARYRK